MYLNTKLASFLLFNCLSITNAYPSSSTTATDLPVKERSNIPSLNVTSAITNSAGEDVSSNFSIMHVHYTNRSLNKRADDPFKCPNPIQCPNGQRTVSVSCRRDTNPQAYSLSCLSAYSQIDATAHAIFLHASCEPNEICVTSGPNAYCSDTTTYVPIRPGNINLAGPKEDIFPQGAAVDGPLTTNAVLTGVLKTEGLVAHSIALGAMTAGEVVNGRTRFNLDPKDLHLCENCASLEIQLPPKVAELYAQAVLKEGSAREGRLWITTFTPHG